MAAAAIIGFLFGFVGSIPVAGPIAVLVLARGVENRPRSGFGIAAGGAVAEGIYAFLAFWGFTELLARHPVVLPISRGAAAVVLAVLGVGFLCRRMTSRPAPERREGWGGSFVLGFTITALNPTLIATWTAAVATLFSTGLLRFERLIAIPFGASAVAGIITWFALLLGLVHRFRERFSEQILNKVLKGMGLVLLGLSAWFVVLLVTSLEACS